MAYRLLGYSPIILQQSLMSGTRFADAEIIEGYVLNLDISTWNGMRDHQKVFDLLFRAPISGDLGHPSPQSRKILIALLAQSPWKQRC